MEETKSNSTKHTFENLREKLNLFNKSLKVQILILSLWIVAAIMLIFFITYEQSTLDLIQYSILPANITWVLILGLILFVFGFGLLFLPVDSKFFEKEIFLRSMPTILEDISITLNNGDFSLVSQKIEEQLELMGTYRIEANKEKFLELMRKAQVNKYCKEKSKLIQTFLDEKKFTEAQTEFAQLSQFFNKNYPLILEAQILEHDELASKFISFN
ncbi:hypothetical protein [Candidatus Lokiarchaeum ossiferum]|uniref:hypothetical protein n=1 Tax=Candidatus Lokiarchaeum ossiferum TaxID=2951803 RepID=UPI00352FE483